MPYKDPKKRREAEKRYKQRNRKLVYERHRRWVEANRERTRAYYRKHAAKHKEDRKNRLYVLRYGITSADKEQMYKDQHGLCGACGLPLPEDFHKADTDHNHVTGRVRSLLHHPCNVAEGIETNNPGTLAKVLEYKKHWDAVEELGLVRQPVDCSVSITSKDTERAKRLDRTYRAKYGITLEDKAQMYAQQNGLCGACGGPLPEDFLKATTDHNHVTKRVRALLHNHCNIAEGIETKHPGVLEKILEYKKRWDAVEKVYPPLAEDSPSQEGKE